MVASSSGHSTQSIASSSCGKPKNSSALSNAPSRLATLSLVASCGILARSNSGLPRQKLTRPANARPSLQSFSKFLTKMPCGFSARLHQSSRSLRTDDLPSSSSITCWIWKRRMSVQMRPRMSLRLPSNTSSAPMFTILICFALRNMNDRFRFSIFCSLNLAFFLYFGVIVSPLRISSRLNSRMPSLRSVTMSMIFMSRSSRNVLHHRVNVFCCTCTHFGWLLMSPAAPPLIVPPVR
mmetsp:Transcript_29689/g.72215  ORF Transcript_29689/g.72215 Transcript_29689/m.72215 type:complete len:237 (-) Transcript_29689:66-776(-)